MQIKKQIKKGNSHGFLYEKAGMTVLVSVKCVLLVSFTHTIFSSTFYLK